MARLLVGCAVAAARLETAPTFSLPVARDSYTGTVMALSGAYGVGFNAFPEMDGADIVLMSAEDGTFAVQDLCATCFSIPVTDVSTDTNVTSTGLQTASPGSPPAGRLLHVTTQATISSPRSKQSSHC